VHESYLKLESIVVLSLSFLLGFLLLKLLVASLLELLFIIHFILVTVCCYSKYVFPLSLHAGLNKLDLIAVNHTPFRIHTQLRPEVNLLQMIRTALLHSTVIISRAVSA